MATDDLFASALEAHRTIFDFMAMRATNVLAAPRFMVEHLECFRPSATMLTSVETVPDAVATDIPPLENIELFEAAINAGHGKYIYSADNEVLVFGEEFMTKCAESIPFG